jgi:hypothetical protein
MKNIIFAALLALITLTACDDGQIEEQRTVFTTGHIVKLTGQLQGLQNWSERYNVALAGFDEKGEYAIIAKTVQADNQGNVNVTLSDLRPYSSATSMIHHDLVSEQNEQYILPLIDSWINNGAKEN